MFNRLIKARLFLSVSRADDVFARAQTLKVSDKMICARHTVDTKVMHHFVWQKHHYYIYVLGIGLKVDDLQHRSRMRVEVQRRIE